MEEKVHRTEENKQLRTGFEPGSRYSRSLAIQLHAKYSCSSLSCMISYFITYSEFTAVNSDSVIK